MCADFLSHPFSHCETSYEKSNCVRIEVIKQSLTKSRLPQSKPPNDFVYISLTKAVFRKYLLENCSHRTLSTTLLQIVLELMLHSKIIFRSMTGPDDIGHVDPQARNGLKYKCWLGI